MLKPTHAAVLLLIAAGCVSQTGEELPPSARGRSDAAALELAVPPGGFQLETGSSWIEPGDDVRICEVVVLPGSAADTYYVPRIEGVLGSFGEELIVQAARPGSDTEAVMEPGARMPCTRAGEVFGEELSDVFSTQQRYTDERFPDGTGQIFHGGQKLAVELHYVNESAEPIAARAKVSFHRADASRVQRIARTASFGNLTIYTPPGGHSTHTGECFVRDEIVVSELVRRTQRYGTSFKVWFAGGVRDGELAWDSQDRENNRYEFSEALLLLPGEGFRFECSYQNSSDRELRYGVSSADETCMLQARYWAVGDSDGADDSAPAEGCLLFDVDGDGVSRP
jgi:hypothetical protein